jgi:hypothetical protein
MAVINYPRQTSIMPRIQLPSHFPRITSCHITALQRIHSTPLVTPSKRDILSQIQITLSRDTEFTDTCMRTHHTLVFILGHVTVYPLPIRLVASRIRHVAPPDHPVTTLDLPVASRRVQNTFTTSLYKLCHTSDSRSREEGGSLHLKNKPAPINLMMCLTNLHCRKVGNSTYFVMRDYSKRNFRPGSDRQVHQTANCFTIRGIRDELIFQAVTISDDDKAGFQLFGTILCKFFYSRIKARW